MTAPASATSTALPRLPDPRTAVVTGAGGPAGIGRVTARVLAENGWHVALVDINADGLAARRARAARGRSPEPARACRPTSPPSPR